MEMIDGDMVRLVLGAGLLLVSLAYVFIVQLFLISREKLVAFPLSIALTLILVVVGVGGLSLMAGFHHFAEYDRDFEKIQGAVKVFIFIASFAFPIFCAAVYYALASTRRIVFPKPKDRQTYINFVAPLFFNAWVMNIIVMWLSYA